MTKKSIVTIAVSAAVVIGAAVAAVPVVKHFKAKPAPEENAPATTAVVENVTEVFAPEVITDENGAEVTGENGKVLTSIVNIAKTTKKAAAEKTTAKSKATTVATTTPVPGGTSIADLVMGPYGTSTIGYRKAAEGYFYTDDKDCWQKFAGYSEFYDNMAPAAGMLIDQVRIRFTYDNKDWMVQFWKGQYGWIFVGAEIGLYTAPAGTYKAAKGDANHYDCADQSDWLYMSLDCYFDQNHDGHYVKIFSRPYAKYWWPTGFVKGQLTKYTAPRTELKVKGRITFKSEEMANLFTTGLRQSGFYRATGSSSLADDTYYQNGKDVWVLWSTIYHDSFVGYEGRNAD